MDDRDQQQDLEQQSLNNAKQVSRLAGSSKVKQFVSTKAREMAIGATKALGKAVLWIAKILLPYILVVIAFLIIVTIGYFLVFEWRGTELEYIQDYQNDVIQNPDGTYSVSENNMTKENKVIRDFYQYYGETSVLKIVGDNDDFLDKDSEEYKKTQDHLKRESSYGLNSHMLLALDDYVYEGKWRYPEQFLKPVAYNKETNKLSPLIDEDGYVIVDSYKQDLETGKRTDEKIKSVRDYGLASILKYNQKEQYTQTIKVKGTYIAEDFWNDKTNEVDTRTINEPFEVQMEPTTNIYMIDNIINFTGEKEFVYQYEDVHMSGLKTGSSRDESKPYTKIELDPHIITHYKEETVVDEVTGQQTTALVVDYEEVHRLYKYRSDDSEVVENIPVVIDTITTKDESNYFDAYMSNLEAYIPREVIEEEALEKRINYDSYVFEEEYMTDGNVKFEVGSLVKSTAFKQASQYATTIQRHANEFGIEPSIILAMIARESSGDNSVKGGLAQISFFGYPSRSITAMNKDGKKVSFTIQKSEIKDPDKSIRFMVMYYKSLFDTYNSHYKAIQGYNLGSGTMKRIANIDRNAWNDEFSWLAYREDARLLASPGSRSGTYTCIPHREVKTGPMYGDSCYLENVLAFYNGTGLEVPRYENSTGFLSGFFKGLFEKMFPPKRDEIEGERIEFIPKIHSSVPKDILKVASAFNNKKLFSDTELGTISFYDESFDDFYGATNYTEDQMSEMTPNGKGFIWPAELRYNIVTSSFGYRIHPIFKDKRLHTGIDISITSGQNVYAVADGIVSYANWLGGYGNFILINHGNGLQTAYAHNSSLRVAKGDSVIQGQTIAKAGSTGNSTGPHIHFEVRVGGKYVDPAPWVKRN